MPRLIVRMLGSEGAPHESPEQTRAECEVQAELVEANLCPHHVQAPGDDGMLVRRTHRPDAPGEPGRELDLGWMRFATGALDGCEIVD